MDEDIVLSGTNKEDLLRKIEAEDAKYFNNPDKELRVVTILCAVGNYRAQLRLVNKGAIA